MNNKNDKDYDDNEYHKNNAYEKNDSKDKRRNKHKNNNKCNDEFQSRKKLYCFIVLTNSHCS